MCFLLPGTTFLGGEDLDERIMNWMADQFLADTGIDLRKDRLALQRLKKLPSAPSVNSHRKRSKYYLPFIGRMPRP